MHYYIEYKIKRQSSGATIAFESRAARHGPHNGDMLTRRRKRCSMSSPHQLSLILLFIHISLFAPVAQGSDQQARWLQSYRMRLEELKAHEERRLQQGTSDVHDSVSTFHVKRYRQLVEEDSVLATIERSLEEKYHIQWQLSQIRQQNHIKRDGNNIKHSQTPSNTNSLTSYPISLSRQLEDAFEGLYTSTYGTNMFCGASWAEASSSCETRQNCPSGQNDECIIPGQQCWAFTECDTRYGDGAQFSEMHGVTGGQNLEATGVGAEASGGYVDLSKPSNDPKDHYFCGKGYEDALSKCLTNCPSGSLNDCPEGEICFFNTPCDARMLTKAPSPPSPTVSPTTPAPVVYSSKLNKYYCGYDWNDAQERCEIWCPSGSDDDCPDDQLCFAFSKCNAVDMNGMTLAQIEASQAKNQTTNGTATGAVGAGSGGPPTQRPTPKPSISAEVAMHRYSFCGAFWADARDNCETKQHCEDDKDCPEFEFCWTQTPCDFLATAPPTPTPPSPRPTSKPIEGKPSKSPTESPIGPPSKKPTPSPTGKPTPTYAPTVTFKPTDIPTGKPISKNDPGWFFFCGESWAHADETCPIRCPSGSSNECPANLECWAFTTCKKEKGYVTEAPTYEPTPAPIVIYVPGLNGAQVPVFGGINFEAMQPTISPAPSSSSLPSVVPTLPPGVVSKQTMASYYCGTDWNDVVKNCHQPCPSGESSECEDPEHSCWAFVEACRARTPMPSEAPISDSPSLSPITLAPTRDPGSPTTPYPTDHPTDIYDLLAKQSQMFYCAATWDGIVCGSSSPCPSGNDSDCPTGESCFQSSLDCSDPQSVALETPAPAIISRAPVPSAEISVLSSEVPVLSSQVPVLRSQEPIIASTPSPSSLFPLSTQATSDSTNIDNEGEDWDSDLSSESSNVDNEGEDWDSPENDAVDNSGEDWSKPVSTDAPTPIAPTPDPTPEPTIDLLSRLEDAKKTMYCAESWDAVDCEIAQPCPSGDDKECPKKQKCFSGVTCGGNSDAATNETTTDEVTSKFFCGSSWETVVTSCDAATPCPSGTNADCPQGEQCFADTPCAASSASEAVMSASSSLDFASMVTLPPYCKDQNTMSRNVGYWQSWSIYRDETCNLFTPESIDASSYSYLVYSFAEISSDGTLDAWNSTEEIDGGIYKQFLGVKERYPSTKLMLAVGGWTHNDPDNERLYRFSRTSSTPKSRMKFAQSSVAFLRKHGFDGLDLDWEYPGDEDRGGNKTLDRENYALLCNELRKYFDQAPEKFELSMAIPASIHRYEIGFDFKELQKSVHFFNVMAYDLHGIWDDPRLTGSHSDIALINNAIEYMTNSSVPSSQIVLGLAAYGRSYTLANKTCLSLGCPFRKDSNETAIGGCLETTGFVPYVEIYDWTEEGEGTGYNSITIDAATSSAVMIKDKNQLISYDNPETFQMKVDFASKKCLGGTMVWAVDMIPVDVKISDSTAAGVVGGESTATSDSQSVLNEEAASQAYCGKTWDDAITSCKTPCPSGSSEDCAADETCYAGTPCGEGGAGAAPLRNSCKICPDPTKQGIRSWVNIDVEINGTATSTTCGNVDYDVFLKVPQKSEECDAAQLSHANECCYDYPENQCWLCQKDAEFYTLRSGLNVTIPDGTVASCSLVDKMLAPSEASSQKCITSRDAYFDECCYRQCSLCEGLGLKWWIEFDEAEAVRILEDAKANTTAGNSTEVPSTCSSIDSSLYTYFVEDGTEECTDIKSTYASQCCYEYQTNPCGLCQKGNASLTLLWANTVERSGKNVTCGLLDNMLNAEPNDSQICLTEKDTFFDSCCFDKCSLCGEKQIAWDFVVDTEAEKTCGQIEAEFTANEIYTTSDECSKTKADFQDACCFIMPKNPCELCEEYVRWEDEVEFDGSKSTCKEVSEMLKRQENTSETCSATKQDLGTSCCYDLCDVCGEDLMLDWDVVIEYDKEQVACGDLKAVFGKQEIEKGSEQCATLQDTYRDVCCYTPPVSPCNLCQTETEYLEAYSSVEVDFFGSPSNCSDVYDYLFRRIESNSETCLSAKESASYQCCYKKCSICEGNQVQDLQAKVSFDGRNISCLQLHTVTTVDVAVDSQDCSNLKSEFAESCCYDAPETPCIVCAEGSIRKDVKVDFNGQAESCENVVNFIGSRMNNGTDECLSFKTEFMEYCCFDKCSICKENDQIDWDTFVEFQGKPDVSCGSFDWYFTSNGVEEGTENCTLLQESFSERCCYTPIDYTVPACSLCKQGDAWYDINGPLKVTYQNESKTCTELSNLLFRVAEDSSDECTQARNEYFSSCCFSKCDLCEGAQLDAMVEVTYNESSTTCLELGLKFAADVVIDGSDECARAKELLFDPCCYSVPTDPCLLCLSDNAQGEVRGNINVDFYGASTTCADLNSFLVSREEQVGFMCQAAKTELQGTCCFEKCDICNNAGNLYWDNPVEFNGLKFACGELTWILGGKMVEQGSKECNEMEAQYFDACCTGPSPEAANAENKCEICPSAKDWYAQITHDGKPMTCLELDSILLTQGVLDQSAECSQAKLEYSQKCCYIPPENPCNLCHVGQKSYSVLDKAMSYNGADTSCYGIYNHLATRVGMDDDMCRTSQNDLFDLCCYDKCSLCEDYQLDPNVNVIHEGTSMGCSEFETNFFGLNEITKGSETCTKIQQQHFNDCCYDIPCQLCNAGDLKYELLSQEPVNYQGKNRTCGDASVLLESEMSQSDACKATKDDLFETCCFMQCNLCKESGWAVDWNHALTYEGLASTCMDVYTGLRSERIKEGDDTCESIKFAVAHECCYKLPTNQCALCQNSNGTFLNTNWNNEVTYLGSTRTCSDVNAILASEELDSAICLKARDDLWNDCCLPQKGGNSDEIGDILASDKEQHSVDSPTSNSIPYGDADFSDLGPMYIRDRATRTQVAGIAGLVILGAGLAFLDFIS